MSVRDVVQAAAGALGGDKVYVEDVFSTYLYTGNGSTQTITNGIDLSGEGGLVWTKSRSSAYNNALVDTVRGGSSALVSNNADAASTSAARLSFGSSGYDVLSTSGTLWNNSGSTYASWTFRKAEKFFDVVTYTGNSTPRTIAHNLGSVPGCIFVKRLDGIASDWNVYHRSLGNSARLLLNSTAQAYDVGNVCWNSTDPTDTVFSLGTNSGVNTNGATYVAYIFAHDAGGFGDNADQDIISCGSFTKSSGVVYSETLGWEPQWLLFKRTDAAENWFMIDNMRSMTVGGTDAYLIPNLSNAESNLDFVTPTATGFEATNNFNNGTYIYIAIRRPMKTPESGTEVFAPVLQDFDGFVNTGFVTDLIFGDQFTGGNNWRWLDRLRGETKYLSSNNTSAEGSASYWKFDYNTGVALTYGGTLSNWMWYNFRRAPGFFDVVAYTGNGSARTLAHNLGVAPEMMIVKRRNGTSSWSVYHQDLAAPAATRVIFLSTTGAYDTSNFYWNSTAPTSTVFTLSFSGDVNGTADTYIAYLFATLAGVSKVGSYTGTAANLDVDCGFSAGARFILIKRTDSAAGWYLWDSERGITAGNDPYLLLNSTDAEVTGTDYIDPLASGFTVTSSATSDLNASGGTYLFLAIA